MRRRLFLASAAAALTLPRAFAAPPPGKYRAFILLPWSERLNRDNGFDLSGGVAARLAPLGYAEGRNLTLTTRFASSQPGAEERVAAEIRAGPANALVVYGVDGADRWKALGVPVLAWGVFDPVGAGLARSLAEPLGNVTGLTQGLEEVPRKHVEVAKALVPDLAGIVFFGLRTAPIPDRAKEFASWEDAAHAAGLRFHMWREGAPSLLKAFASLRKQGYQAVFYPRPPGAHPSASEEHAREAIRCRIAITCVYQQTVQHGFLAAYGEHEEEFELRIAQQLDRIFRSGSAAGVPFINPARYYFRLNLRTAAALRLRVPARLKLMADRLDE